MTDEKTAWMKNLRTMSAIEDATAWMVDGKMAGSNARFLGACSGWRKSSSRGHPATLAKLHSRTSCTPEPSSPRRHHNTLRASSFERDITNKS